MPVYRGPLGVDSGHDSSVGNRLLLALARRLLARSYERPHRCHGQKQPQAVGAQHEGTESLRLRDPLKFQPLFTLVGFGSLCEDQVWEAERAPENCAMLPL